MACLLMVRSSGEEGRGRVSAEKKLVQYYVCSVTSSDLHAQDVCRFQGGLADRDSA